MMKIHILKLCRTASGVRCAQKTHVLAPTCRKRHAPHLKLCALESYLPTCINPCKSGDGSCLKNRPPHPRGGGRSGNFKGSKNQNSGKCHELSRKSIKFVFYPSHPWGFRGGGSLGSKFQKSGKFHELSRKSIKKKTPPKGVAVGILGGQNIKSPGNIMKCREK